MSNPEADAGPAVKAAKPEASKPELAKPEVAEPKESEIVASETPSSKLPAKVAGRTAGSATARPGLAWFDFSLERSIERVFWFILVLLAAAV